MAGDDPDVPTRLAAAVSADQVRALLLARAPEAIDDTSQAFEAFAINAALVATEVAPFAGNAENDTLRWSLCVTAVTVGTAAVIEAAMFPEQQGLGDQGRSRSLQLWFERLLKQLQTPLGDDDTGATDLVANPQGSFPRALPYPDRAPEPYAHPCGPSW